MRAPPEPDSPLAMPAVNGGSSIQDPALPSADEVATTLRDVLSRPEFQRVEESESILGRMYRWLLEWFARHPIELPSLPGGAVVDVLAIAVMAAAVALLLRTFVRHRARRGTRPTRVAQGAPRPETAIDRTAEEWEARARELAATGQARDAALALYQSVLRRLADAGFVRYHASKTPGDYRREVGGREVARPYAAFLAGFEPIAFGPGSGAGADVAGLFPLARAAAPHHG